MKAVVSLRCLGSSYNAGKDDSNNFDSDNMLPLHRLQACLYLLSKLCFASIVCFLSTLQKSAGRKKRKPENAERILTKMNRERQAVL